MDVAVLLGDSAQFNVAANGSEPLFYQWRHAGTNLPGATSPILYIPSVQEINAGDYKVIVSNVAGTNVSATVQLTIATPPAITLQPKSQSVRTNANVTLSVLATGNPLPTYRWMRNGTNVPGGTASTLNLINVQTNSGGVFKVMVGSAAGNTFSSNATLYVGWPLTLTNLLFQQNGAFRTDLIGLPQTNYIFQGSGNLSNWVSLATNSSPQGVVPFTDDPNGPTGQRRFYRAKVQ
jgi:hypothetical protein